MNGVCDSAADALGNAERLLERRLLAEAAGCFRSAEEAGAEPNRCAAGRWMTAMLAGDFEAAWQESDAIRHRGGHDPHRFWQGEPIAGKRVIVRCLHGLGDSVQMLRYLPRLQACCGSVVVEAPPRLLPLAPCFAGMQQAVTWGDGAPAVAPAWDVQVEVMELPYLFRTLRQDLPLAEHYLSAPSALTGTIAKRMGTPGLPRIGIVWSASEWDSTRCLPKGCVEHLLRIPGVEFWNLQGGEQHALGRQSPLVAAIADAANFGDGLLPLAATIACLDLLITVDTLAAHLAGAMGKPAWVLLQTRADWRWMHDCEDSPWYPTLRLWRQPQQGDWWALTEKVAGALTTWAEGRRSNAA